MSTRPRKPAPATPAPGKLPLTELAEMKQRRQRIVMVTAYDAPSGRLADEAGMDIVLVGDSAAMTVLGHSSTVPATMDEMIVLARAVTRGARRPLVVADMPFGSFQVSDETAVENAVRFVKEAGADAVKIEGAGPMLSRVRALVGSGIPVMGHIGLTPQSATMLGGFKAQGRSAEQARQLFEDALALEEAGCFSLVLECVPPPVAARITSALHIPTIGIGAGAECDGQVLVWHDLLGLYQGRAPRFVKRYADLATVARDALETYADDVRSGAFPEEQHTYSIPDEELALFERPCRGLGEDRGGQQQAEQRGGERGGAEGARDAPLLHGAHADDREQQCPGHEDRVHDVRARSRSSPRPTRPSERGHRRRSRSATARRRAARARTAPSRGRRSGAPCGSAPSSRGCAARAAAPRRRASSSGAATSTPAKNASTAISSQSNSGSSKSCPAVAVERNIAVPARIVTATIGSESASACSSEESRSSANTSPGRTRISGRRRHHPRSSRLISSARDTVTAAKLQVVTWQDRIVETAVVIAFPELSPVVDDWRERTCRRPNVDGHPSARDAAPPVRAGRERSTTTSRGAASACSPRPRSSTCHLPRVAPLAWHGLPRAGAA